MSVMQESRSPGSTRRRFTKEFKPDAVALVCPGSTFLFSIGRVGLRVRVVW